MNKINEYDFLKNYSFSVYEHNLVIYDNRLIKRQFIVIKHFNGYIVAFTNFHKYIHSSNKKGAKSISDNGNNRFYFVAQFLNYILFDQHHIYKANKISEITLTMIKDFFRHYGLDERKPRIKSTVDRCTVSIIDFMISFIKENKKVCKLKIEDFTIEEKYQTKRGVIKTKLVPNFEVFYLGKPKKIFRDMPNSVFSIVLAYAAEHYKDIFFIMILSAFAGLRPSEACNIRQEISPLGSSLIFRKINGKTVRVYIDLTEEKNLRSDLVSVGEIKKERKQEVYPRFIEAFEYAYNLHKKYLTTCKFEKEYCPMSVNSQGKAITYSCYLFRFKKMMRDLIPIFYKDNNPEVVEFAHDLLENNISPHIFRHWFSVRLTLYGEDIAGLQYWRGDNSPESALIYLQNKGELEKQLRTIGNELFDYMSFHAVLEKECSNNE